MVVRVIQHAQAAFAYFEDVSSEPVPDHLLERIRSIALALPEAIEKEAWGHPTFRAGTGKMFASAGMTASGQVTMSMKAPVGEQELLIESSDHIYFPKYVGKSGWIGVTIDEDTNWDEIAELVEESFRQQATRDLVVRLGDD